MKQGTAKTLGTAALGAAFAVAAAGTASAVSTNPAQLLPTGEVAKTLPIKPQDGKEKPTEAEMALLEDVTKALLPAVGQVLRTVGPVAQQTGEQAQELGEKSQQSAERNRKRPQRQAQAPTQTKNPIGGPAGALLGGLPTGGSPTGPIG